MLFKRTDLWRNAFDVVEDADFHSEARNRLKVAYNSFWNRAVELSSSISEDLPDLTLHEERHFEALWRCADIIEGSQRVLNPLELFIFGSAILIHDLAHAVKTFPGGLNEIKQTAVWKDAIAAVSEQEMDVESNTDDAILKRSKQALFVTLRTLHAERAEQLAFISFKNHSTGATSFLIEDEMIRNHLGELIGQIAASHHWPIEKIAQEFNSIRGAPSDLPYQWSINPLRIACLLRCSDAVQIDQSRAPDFLYALLELNGISEKHWLAQSRLAAPIPDAKDSKSIVFTSTKMFSEDDAEAWWIAFEAISVADRELDDCNRLLRDLGIPAFQINGVRDARSPTRLVNHIKAKGWRPVRAKPRMGSTSRIIGMMGGAQLYGGDVTVPLRELIQNAADAVRARRIHEKDPRYEGRITIYLKPAGDLSNSWQLIIEDDGIGMSEQVLTGPLIEFGTSYWQSDLARFERPGLASAKLFQTGGFGIGFFSSFMISDRISITSRKYDSGLDEFRTLEFRNGLSSHPILLDGARPLASSSVSTRAILTISSEKKEELFQVQSRRFNDEPVLLTLAQLVSHLCPCLDCDVYIQECTTGSTRVHRRDWHKREHRIEWLKDVVLAHARHEDGLQEYIESAAGFLQEFETKDGRVNGLACLAYRNFDAGVTSVGGLIGGNIARSPLSFSRRWVGALAAEPEGPKRWIGYYSAGEDQLARWAQSQVELQSLNTERTSLELHVASVNAAEFGTSPYMIFQSYLNRELVAADRVLKILEAGACIFLPVSVSGLHDNDCSIDAVRSNVRHFSFLLSESDMHLQKETIEKIYTAESRPVFYMVPGRFEDLDKTLLGCLVRLAEGGGHSWRSGCIRDVCFATYTGPDSPREHLVSGQALSGPAIWFSLDQYNRDPT